MPGVVRLAILGAGLLWILQHAIRLDPFWHLDGIWVRLVAVLVFAAIGWRIYKVSNDPWFEFSPAFDALKAKYDSAKLIEPTELHALTNIQMKATLQSDPNFIQLEDHLLPLVDRIFTAYVDIIDELYLQDRKIIAFPDKPDFDLWRSKEYYSLFVGQANAAIESTQLDGPRVKLIIERMTFALRGLLEKLTGRAAGPFRFPIAEILPDPAGDMCATSDWLYDSECQTLHVGDTFRATFNANRASASVNSKLLTKKELDAGAYVQPRSYPATTAVELAYTYWKRTKFYDLFACQLPWGPSEEVRFEHQWVVAPSGTGKTTLLQTQIADDLQRVAKGECSIIVIDSQNQLIPKIAHLKLFAPGQPLDGKLVVIEPDPDYPPALNVLDIGLGGLSARDQYRMQAEALENVKSCMATMADTQDDMLSYLVELCFVIPGATIQTIVEILKPNGLDDYRHFLDDVDQTCRDYFETTFSPRSQGTNVTKEALLRRLMGMLRNPTFRRMFLNERGKFNMAKELETSKVILINTDLEFLRHDACQLFGRFFIAQLLQAAEMRGEKSLPVFCYIDECQDYIANDDNAAKLMDKARKRKVGMIFAHQRIQNIESPNVRDALSNVGVRFAGGNETDAQYLSRIFRTEPEFIAQKQRGTFACFVRRQTQHAIEVKVPRDVLERMERMSEEEYNQIRDQMRARYCQPASQERRPTSVDSAPAATPIPQPTAGKQRRKRQVDPDAGERTTASGNWEP
jgi:hypothetical protein